MSVAVEAQTLHDLVVKAYNEVDGNVDEAVKNVRSLLLSDAELLNNFVVPLIDDAIRYRCRRIRQTVNEHILEDVSSLDRMTKANPQLAAGLKDANQRDKRDAGILMRLLNYVLPDGTKMKDATRPVLQSCIALQRAQAKTMFIRAEWWANVAAALPNDKVTVGKALKAERLKTLYEKAEKQITP